MRTRPGDKAVIRRASSAAGRTLLACLSLAAGLTSGPLSAQDAKKYPEKPITIVVPFATGGTTDNLTRAIGQRLGERWGVTVVVEAKPGAGGNIGAAHVARAAPDGYTLLMGSIGTHAINPGLYKTMPYDAQKSFSPITRTAVVPNALIVPRNAPYDTVAELVAYGKAHPGRLTFASSGYGSSLHMAGETFKLITGVDMVHVPYKGNAPAMVDLLGGQISMIFDNLPSALPNVKNGSLKVLAVTSSERSDQLPDVPTLSRELGVPGYEVVSWFGLWAPAGTPSDIVDKINKAVVDILRTPQMVAQIRGWGAIPHPESPAEFDAFIRSEGKRWAGVVREANLKVE